MSRPEMPGARASAELATDHLARRFEPQWPRRADGGGDDAPQHVELALQVIGLEKPGGRGRNPRRHVSPVLAIVVSPADRGQQRLGRMSEFDPIDSVQAHVAGTGKLACDPARQARRRVHRLADRHRCDTGRSDSAVRPSSGHTPLIMLSMIP